MSFSGSLFFPPPVNPGGVGGGAVETMGNRSHVSEARDEPVNNTCSSKVRYKLQEANINHSMLLALIKNNSVIPEEEILR